MVAIFTPILIALNEDVQAIKYDLKVILAPLSLAWVGLIVVFILIVLTINRSYNEI